MSEKDKRRYTAIEILKLPYGGKRYIRDLLNCSFLTIDKGLEEIKENELTETARIRKSGGGRKPGIDNIAGINDLFLNVLKDFIAGDPMDKEIKWTHYRITVRYPPGSIEKDFSALTRCKKNLQECA